MNNVNDRGLSVKKYELFPLSSSKIDISYAKTIQIKPFLNC
jgi:hypothetical protein